MYLDLILEGNGERWQVNVSPSIWYCLLEKGDFIIFQTGDRLCHLDVEDCHKKKKKKILYNICLSLAQTDKKLVSPM